MSANLRELSKQMEAELFGSAPGGGIQDAAGFWLNQINGEGQTIINAARSERQGVRLTGLTVFRFDTSLQFKERIEAREGDAGRRGAGHSNQCADSPSTSRRSNRKACTSPPP